MKFNRLTKATMVFAAAALVLSGCASGGNGGGDAGTSGGGDSEVKSLGDSAGPYTPTGDEVSTTPDAELHALLPADVTDAGVLNIAVDTLYPPMTFFDDNKRLIGFDAELGRLIGQKLDIPVSLNHQNFDAVIPSLQAGKNDMIMEGMNDTMERQKTLSFVDYSKGGFLILVKKGNPAGITTKTDLCGKTVSIQKATVQGDLLNEMDCGVKSSWSFRATSTRRPRSAQARALHMSPTPWCRSGSRRRPRTATPSTWCGIPRTRQVSARSTAASAS